MLNYDINKTLLWNMAREIGASNPEVNLIINGSREINGDMQILCNIRLNAGKILCLFYRNDKIAIYSMPMDMLDDVMLNFRNNNSMEDFFNNMKFDAKIIDSMSISEAFNRCMVIILFSKTRSNNSDEIKNFKRPTLSKKHLLNRDDAYKEPTHDLGTKVYVAYAKDIRAGIIVAASNSLEETILYDIELDDIKIKLIKTPAHKIFDCPCDIIDDQVITEHKDGSFDIIHTVDADKVLKDISVSNDNDDVLKDGIDINIKPTEHMFRNESKSFLHNDLDDSETGTIDFGSLLDNKLNSVIFSNPNAFLDYDHREKQDDGITLNDLINTEIDDDYLYRTTNEEQDIIDVLYIDRNSRRIYMTIRPIPGLKRLTNGIDCDAKYIFKKTPIQPLIKLSLLNNLSKENPPHVVSCNVDNEKEPYLIYIIQRPKNIL